MTIDDKIDALRQAIAEATSTLDAAIADRDAATDGDHEAGHDAGPGKPQLLTAADGAAEARRRHPRKDEATGQADGDAGAAQLAGSGAAAGRAEAQRRHGARR
jgi:hypothetical protein